MGPATRFFLTIEHDRVVVQYNGTHGGFITRLIRSPGDLKDFLRSKAVEAGCTVEGLTVECSSTLDFPEEATQNAKTIATARAIRT